MTEMLDSDRAVVNHAGDAFGFIGIAESLAPRIVETSIGDGLVIGLEGSWGSGKSSLLNLIRQEIADLDNDNIHTLTVAPWLDGDSSSLVLSLLGQMARILEDKSDEVESNNSVAEKAKRLSKLVALYGEKTARWGSPVAKLAGHLIPGGKIVSNMLESTADILGKFNESSGSVSDLKESISEEIKQLEQGFIVFLDDLDRLEPEQAVEVVRLVRSVADFPNVVYLMCYDREVLSNGLKVGLNVEDGDLFLQKIVQLTFQIPRLEPFDLRQQFLKEAELIYSSVHNEALCSDALNDLRWAVDTAGNCLSTPREVKLALNAVRFIYPSIFSDVYFPDLCWLHLIKIKRYDLYRWLEEYLSIRSIVVTGEGNINKDGKVELGKRLQEIAVSDDYTSVDSFYNLSKYVPGIGGRDNKPEDCVFGFTSESVESNNVSHKKVGSPIHYRYYFALTGPRSVMPDEEFSETLRQAESDLDEFSEYLIEYAREHSALKIDQLLFRLEAKINTDIEVNIVCNLVCGIANAMDIVMLNQKETGIFARSLDTRVRFFIEKALKKIGSLDNGKKYSTGLWLVQSCSALNWIVGVFFRRQYFKHGRDGSAPKAPEDLIFSEREFDSLLAYVRDNFLSKNIQHKLAMMPKLTPYLFAWREMAEDDNEVRDWVADFCKNEACFLRLLDSLRHKVTSDRVYYPLSKETVSSFLDWDKTVSKLNSMKDGEHADKVRELQQAIEEARNW